jgi:hypothetical protein
MKQVGMEVWIAVKTNETIKRCLYIDDRNHCPFFSHGKAFTNTNMKVKIRDICKITGGYY